MDYLDALYRQAFIEHRHDRPPPIKLPRLSAGAGLHVEDAGSGSVAINQSDNTSGDRRIAKVQPTLEEKIADPLPIICSGMPEGDVVFKITESEYRAWALPGKWHVHYTASGGETHTSSGGGGDIFDANAKKEIESDLACAFEGQFSPLRVITTYYGHPTGDLVIDGNISFTMSLQLGLDGNSFFAGVRCLVDNGTIADSNPIPGTGQGTMTVDLEGHTIPLETRWTLGYSSLPGYTNNIVFKFDVNRIPLN